MGKFKKARRAWQRLPQKTKQQIKRKARGILGRTNDSSENNQN
jgi:mRNA-degrading endonuclease RelE of RelBE toxin-antitoxin system